MKKWIWAIDPFLASQSDDDLNLQKSLFSSLKTLAEGTSAEQEPAKITPVYVLSRGTLNWTGAFSGNWIPRLSELARSAYQKAREKSEQNWPAHLHIIVSDSGSLRGSVDHLVSFAKDEGAMALGVTTHARSGIERWMLGSFAETVLLTSRCSVFLQNPKSVPLKARPSVLFPTDFSPSSQRAWNYFAKHLIKLSGKVVIYHKSLQIVEPLIQSGVLLAGGGWVNTTDYTKARDEAVTTQMAELQEKAKSVGLTVETLISDSMASFGEDAANFIQRKGVDLVMMGSHASANAAIVFGSATRDLLRHSNAALWVLPVLGEA